MTTVEYKGHNLATNSEAYKLFLAKEFDKLDAHLKQVVANYKKLTGIK